MENIFSRLYKYKPQLNMTPEENFFTESFKFVLESDRALCNKFVEYISGRHLFTQPFKLESQVRYDSSIIDLEITDKKGKKIFVEIKVSAHENRYFEEEEKEDYGQIEKYLRLNDGYVCFISQKEGDIEIKTNKEKYLGQFEWFQIYKLIEDHYKSQKNSNGLDSYFVTNFLKFMKDLGMQPFQGFTKEDIAASQSTALGFYSKLSDFLDCVKKDNRIVQFFKKNHLKFNAGPDFDSNQFLRLRFQKNDRSGLWADMGFQYLDLNDFDGSENEQGIYYIFYIWLRREKIEAIKNNIGKFNLSSKYVIKEECLCDGFVVYNEIFFPEFIKNGDKKAVDYIYETFLELEKKGVLREINKVLNK